MRTTSGNTVADLDREEDQGRPSCFLELGAALPRCEVSASRLGIGEHVIPGIVYMGGLGRFDWKS